MQEREVFFKRSEMLPFIELRQANSSSACYHKHSHDEFSFGVIDEGDATYINRGKTHHITAGSTVTINPADTHSCNPKAGSWSYRMLFVDTLWITHLQDEMLYGDGQDYRPFLNPLESDVLTFNSFDLLFKALLAETNSLETESLLIEFLSNCYAKDVKQESTKKEFKRMGMVKELIMDQLDMNLTLDEFSRQTDLSRFHLIRSFKQNFGLSPHAYQLDQRIIKAKRLLQNGMSIADTAVQLGFSDQAHFQRNFKKRLAVTPGQYQKHFV